MSNPYSSQSISNYNTSPPPDDGSQTASNEITWAGIKSKLVDPVKTLAEAINTAVSSAFTTFTATMASTYAALGTANTFTANQTIQASDDTSGLAPSLNLDRNSASPATSDSLGVLQFSGRNASAAETAYARIEAQISSPTAGEEDGALNLDTVQGGSMATRVIVFNGLSMQGTTGGDKGAGSINATSYYKSGVAISGLAAGTALTLNPYAANTTTTQAHGLSVAPDMYKAVLECLTAELGYSIGDKIPLPIAHGNPSAPQLKYTVYHDATNVNLITAATGTISILNKSTRAEASITAANWKLTITPYKLV